MKRNYSNNNNDSTKLSRNRIIYKSSRLFNINFKNYFKNNNHAITSKNSCERYRRKKVCSFTKLFPLSLLIKKRNILPSQKNIKSKNKKNKIYQYNLKKEISMKYKTISNESSNKPKPNLKTVKLTSRTNLKVSSNLLSNRHNRKTKVYGYKSSNNLCNNKHINEYKKQLPKNKNSYFFLSNNNSLNYSDEKNNQNVRNTHSQKRKKINFINSNNYYFFVNNSINVQKNCAFPKTKIFINNKNPNFKIIKNSNSYNTMGLGTSNRKKTMSNRSSKAKNKNNSPNYSCSPTNSLKKRFNKNTNSNSNSIKTSKNAINTIYNINKKTITTCYHDIKIKKSLKKNIIMSSNNGFYFTNITNTNNNTQNNTNANSKNHSLKKLLNNNHQNIKQTKLILTNRDCLKSKINFDDKKYKNKKNNTRKNILEIKEKEKNKPIKIKTTKEIINITIDNTINNIVNINSLPHEKKINYNIQTNNETTNLNNNIKENNPLSLEKNLQINNKTKEITIPNKTSNNKTLNKNSPNQIITNDNRINTYPSTTNQAIIANKQKILTTSHNTNNIERKIKRHISKSKSFKDRKQNRLKENVKKIREQHKKKNIKTNLKNLKNTNNTKLLDIKEIFTNLVNRKFKNLCKTPKNDKYSKFKKFSFIQISEKFNKTQDINNGKNIMSSEKKSSSKLIINISEDPQYVYEYINDIFLNLLIEENNYFEKINMEETLNIYDNKFVISSESRKFFINSLINIQDVLNISEHTLFLAVQIFDRYINEVLSKEKNIIEENLDIVIVTSLIIAAKREELKLYPMSDYLNLLPDKYSLKDLIKQEFEILNKFCFELLIPNSLCFYELLSAKCKLDKIQFYKGLYLLNVILLDSNMLQIPPSLIAYSIIKIISGNDLEEFLEKLNDKYEDNGVMKRIRIISVLKDLSLINNLCEFIKYSEKGFKESVYDSVINKFKTPQRYFVSSYIDI